MAIDDETRRINILEPLSRLITAMEASIQTQLSEYIDTEGRLIVKDENEYTYVSLYWDRIDEALFVDVQKREVPGKGWDETNTYDEKTHRIYPSFVAGAPTVAAQFERQKLGYVTTELPVGNSMTATFSSLSTIELEFTNDIIAASVTSGSITVEALPVGEILSLTVSSAGVGYLSTGSNLNDITTVDDYTLSFGSGSDATVTVTANPTTATVVTPTSLGRGFVIGDVYSTYNGVDVNNQTFRLRASGLTIQVLDTDGEGAVVSFEISEGGTGYLIGDQFTINNGSIPATFTVDTISGGDITSVEISGGGISYEATDVLTVETTGFTVVTPAQLIVTSVVESYNISDDPVCTGVTYSEPKTKTMTVSFSPGATYSNTYRVSARRVLNLAKQKNELSAVAATEAATLPCPAITSILFEAYGSGSQSILPRTLVEYNATHSNTQFLYYGTEGISWAEFITQSEFTGANPPIEVPESITHPDTVYAYYRDGAYLLPDSSWIVGIIGSETDYEGNYEYVLYTLDNILNYKQLTTAGSSTAPCGTSDWGGDWGASIQQFAIRR